MKRISFTIYSCLLFSLLSFSQSSITGIVKDIKTDLPVDAVNVFVAHTSIGTLTDAQGNFELKNIPESATEIVLSHIAYQSIIRKIKIRPNNNISLTFNLQATAVDLLEISVKALKPNKRKRYFNKFKTAFLGSSPNASKCVITNPEILTYKLNAGKLEVMAEDLIEIKNNATGYHLKFLLESFSKEGDITHYSGKPVFSSIKSTQRKEKDKWNTARLKTYHGSSRHFYKSLIDKKLNKEGFSVFYVKQSTDGGFEILSPAPANQLLIKANQSNGKNLVIPDFIQVIYTKEKDYNSNESAQLGDASKLGHPAESDMIGQEKRAVSNHDKGQISYLFARKSKVFINDQGYLTRPELIIEYGFWAREGVADLLPLDYSVKNKAKVSNKIKTDPILNGFELSNLLIPFDEIKKGGPPKDGIPSIDRPSFLAANYVDFLKADDKILAVVRNGKIKAYPIKILDRHEIVNDLFDDETVVITYCPLCGSGMAFLANVAQRNRSFGVSGLLYNSDVLLYDRESQSLWSQIMSKSIAGKSSGQQLEFIPTIHTTWSKWKEQYPNTLVLTNKTGFNYNYDNIAYAGYEDTPKLLFPVANESKAFAKKEKVIGIEVNGKFKAYPFSKLKKSKGIITDVFNGQTLKITFDKAAWVAIVRDEVGNDFPALTLYWFAWYAFHPDTEVYTK